MTVKKPKTIKHYTASVFVLSTGLPAKALLHHHRKYDKWMPAGGHQETWENPIEAVIREAMEETGVDIAPFLNPVQPIDEYAGFILMPKYFLEELIPAHGKEPAHVHLDQIYVVRIPEQAANHNAKESHDIGWFTLEETEKLPTFENVRMILRQELTV